MNFIVDHKKVILNMDKSIDSNHLMDSPCLKEIWGNYVDEIKEKGKFSFLRLFDYVQNPKEDFLRFFKLVLNYQLKDILKYHYGFDLLIMHSEEIYTLVEGFYDYWRRLERYAIIHVSSNQIQYKDENIQKNLAQFSEVILNTYRTISEKLLGEEFGIYRSLPAGVNASLSVSYNKWMARNSRYSFLSMVEFINQIIIKPPFISYTAKNKRTGTYPEVFENPVEEIQQNFKAEEYYCYAAHVGSALAYVYFHRDYLSHGVTLCNLFDFIPLSKCYGQKPELLYIFGADVEKESVFFHDKDENIYVGIAPHNSSIDYFGYMKKMLLTLYNVKMINQGNLPLHGACVNITMKDGRTKNVVIIGDSGAGKSETLAALSECAGANISDQLTVFDDMGTFKLENGRIYAYGTEIGAFVRLDDMALGYAYKEMDRAIFMNPDKINSRLVIPVATYGQIMKGYPVDMVLYANNYEETNQPLKIFKNKEEALKVFIKGARKAKGTTQEIGLVESFFANPFGPVQRMKQTQKLLDLYFTRLFNDNIIVGELYTQLAVSGKEHEGPGAAAEKLFEILK